MSFPFKIFRHLQTAHIVRTIRAVTDAGGRIYRLTADRSVL